MRTTYLQLFCLFVFVGIPAGTLAWSPGTGLTEHNITLRLHNDSVSEIAKAIAHAVNNPVCQHPYFSFMDGCYLISPYKFNQTTAALYCLGMDGHLAYPIHTTLFWEHIRQRYSQVNMAPTDARFHIKGSGTNQGGKWRFKAGKNFEFEIPNFFGDWYLEGLPENREFCLVYRRVFPPLSLVDCAEEHKAICKYGQE